MKKKLLDSSETIKRKTLTINFVKSFRKLLYLRYEKEIDRYWKNNPEEKKEYEAAVRAFYADLAWGISGFKDISTSTAHLAIYWTGQIQGNKELMELGGSELKGDLVLLAGTVSPTRKLQKMMGVKKKVGVLKTKLKLKNIKITGFKNLDTHYNKHGKEFYGVNSKSEYQRKAEDFLKNTDHKDIKVWTRNGTIKSPGDGAILKGDLKTGTIVIIHKDGKIGTFHKNNDFLNRPENFINKNN